MSAFNVQEMIGIMAACTRYNVSSFKYGDFALEFQNKSKEKEPLPVSEAPSVQLQEPVADPDILMVEDPLAYERWHSEQQEAD